MSKKTRRPMTVEEEEKFKDDMMKQAEKQLKEGTPDTQEGVWEDTTNIKEKLEKQSKENQILQEVPVEDIPYEVRDGVNPQTFNKQLIEPGNPMLRTPVAPYKDELLKEFGIKDRKTAKKMSVFSDGVVVGSAIVDIISNKQDLPFQDIFSQISKFVEGIKSSIQ